MCTKYKRTLSIKTQWLTFRQQLLYDKYEQHRSWQNRQYNTATNEQVGNFTARASRLFSSNNMHSKTLFDHLSYSVKIHVLVFHFQVQQMCTLYGLVKLHIIITGISVLSISCEQFDVLTHHQLQGIASVVNKDLTLKAKAKDLTLKAKDLTFKAKAKDLTPRTT